jgi:UMF1 family MFS transporter
MEPHEAERRHNRSVRAWALYDWANSGYVTSTATTLFPPYFIAIAAPAFVPLGVAAGIGTDALARGEASNTFALAASLALALAALLAPLVGAFADITGKRKRLLVVITAAGSVTASAMVGIGAGDWVLALVLYGAAQVGLHLAVGLESSLLPFVATGAEIDQVSSRGYALGYVGGGVLLAAHAGLIMLSARLGLTEGEAVRIAFLTVGVWWFGFTLPLVRHVPEPPGTPAATGTGRSAFADSVRRLVSTLRSARRYRQLFTMLIAFWLYMEGVGSIILLATAYGATLGLDTGVLVLTLLVTQFVAYPYSLVFGRVASVDGRGRGRAMALILWSAVTIPALGWYAHQRSDLSIAVALALVLASQLVGVAVACLGGESVLGRAAATLSVKRSVILGLLVYTIVPIWGFFLTTRAEFVLLGWLVGTVQGGTQALSRSLYARLAPRALSGELFGLYGLAEKLAGILGPLLYGVIGTITKQPRISVLSVVFFFVAGMVVLARVDEHTGARVAAEEDALLARRTTTDASG